MPKKGNERVRIAVPNLREWRVWKLLELGELAEKANLSVATVVRVEQGQSATLATVRKLAQALDISREQLVRGHPPAENNPAKLRGAA